MSKEAITAKVKEILLDFLDLPDEEIALQCQGPLQRDAEHS